MTQADEGKRRDWSTDAVGGLIMMIAVALAVGAGIAGFFLGRDTKHSTVTTATSASPQASATVDPHVAAGGHVFVQFACAQCHGLQGNGGVSPDVPDVADDWVRRSAPPRCATSSTTGSASPTNPMQAYTPVWGAVISDQQVSDLSRTSARAYHGSNGDAAQVPTGQGLAVAGSALYVRDGCINCHGPNGLGGVRIRFRPTRRSPRCRAGTSGASSTPRPRSRLW